MLSKCNCIIIFAIMLFLVILYNISNSVQTIEGFNPYLDYSRIYPSLYAFTGDYGPYNKSYYMFPDGYYQPYNRSVYPGNFRYNPGYSDYWYIPKHEYLKSWMGVPETVPVVPPIPTNCVVPASISEYCVNQHIQENGNLDLAIGACTVPPSISESCTPF